MNRRFSDSQRIALYLSQDGRCASCGVELAPGWHGDHVEPWSAGGATDVLNGKALCPTCNLKKGARVRDPRFRWQQQLLDRYRQLGQRDFLLCATPGAGKTRAAFQVAADLFADGIIDHLIVVVPTDSLRQQWADAAPAGLQLRAASNREHAIGENRDFHGEVLTYHQIAQQPQLFRAITARHRTLVVFDELHHAADSASWGVALRTAFEGAERRLSLTGTPWRRDNNLIPFVHYDDDGKVVADFAYRYGEAVREGVVRPIRIDAFDGELRWQDSSTVVSATLGADLDDEDIPMALRCAFDPKADWIPGILRRAHEELLDLRGMVTNAGGLVIAHDQWTAQQYAVHLERITGQRPTLVISDVEDAQQELERFKRGTSTWLVAVRMVSEGVDIPRLAVGVYASKIRTPLFFKQIVGRFVRRQEHDEHSATLYIPAIPQLMDHARAIEDELRHTFHEINENFIRERDGEPLTKNQQFDFRSPLSASAPEFAGSIFQGEELASDERDRALAICDEYNIPRSGWAGVARFLRNNNDQQPTPTPASPRVDASQSIGRQQEQLRAELYRLTKRMAHVLDIDQKDAQTKIRIAYGPRSQMTVQELSDAIEWVAGWTS